MWYSIEQIKKNEKRHILHHTPCHTTGVGGKSERWNTEENLIYIYSKRYIVIANEKRIYAFLCIKIEDCFDLLLN